MSYLPLQTPIYLSLYLSLYIYVRSPSLSLSLCLREISLSLPLSFCLYLREIYVIATNSDRIMSCTRHVYDYYKVQYVYAISMTAKCDTSTSCLLYMSHVSYIYDCQVRYIYVTSMSCLCHIYVISINLSMPFRLF